MNTQPEPKPPGEKVPPALAAFLSGQREHITGRWIEAVRRNPTFSASKEVSDEELADHLPKLFEDLTAALGGKPTADEAKRDAEAHGDHRWRQHYDLEEILLELGIVSRAVLSHGLDAFADEHPETPKELLRGARERILRFFEDAAAGSVRRFAQRSRREANLSEERHRLAIEGAHQGTFTWELPSRRVHWNDRMKELFFLPPETEMSLELGISRLHPDDREPTRRAVEAAMAGRTSYRIEYRSVNPEDGQVRWLRATGRAFADPASGALTQVHGVTVDVTAEKLAQQQAAVVAQREHTILESITDSFFAFDAEWCFTYLNEAAKRGMAGHVDDPASLLGRNFFEVFPYNRGTPIEQAGVKAMAEGVMTEFEMLYEPWDRWYYGRCFPIQGGGLSVYFRETTQERQAAETLQASETRYRSLFNSIDNGFCVIEVLWDEQDRATDYRFVEVNPAFEGHTGLRDAVGKTIRGMHPGFEQTWVDRYGRVARTGQAARFVEGSDVLGRWFEVYAFPVGMGSLRQVAVLFNDITERRRAEEILQSAKTILQESEARFRQLADAMPQIVWTARPDGVLDYTNQRWYEYILRAESDWNVEDWHLRVHPDDIAGAGAVWAGCVASGEPYATEFRVQRGDGEYRWFLVRALPIKEADGTIAHWYGTCTDIHEQRALLEQNARLLDSERAARSEAERTGRMKDEFLATLSHELRTPLNAVLGWTQVLRGDPTNSQDVESGLATIERNARAQNQIIEDLLDMSRIVSGKVRLDVQPLELDHVIRSAVETVRPAADAKSIRLQALIDPEARMISGDPSRLQQVFWNLLSNAIKFTPKGGRVQVVLERVNSHLEVRVTDSGEGVTAEFLPYVFDRFRQQDASTTRQHGGLGLGLAIVRQLVELHGGSVHAESGGAGQGTTFRVLLPLRVVRSDADLSDTQRVHPGASACTSPPTLSDTLTLNGVKVLVVDDEADARALVKRLLEDRGASVHTAGSAAEALQRLQAERPAVLVSDIGMPGEDGYALIRQVRGLPTELGGNVPAMALTAYARSEDRLKVILAGFQMHLAKPIEAAEFLALVASLAGRTNGPG